MIATAVARDPGEPPDALRPRLVAAALSATRTALAKYRSPAEEPWGDAEPDVYSLLEYVVRYNEAGIAAVLELPEPPF